MRICNPLLKSKTNVAVLFFLFISLHTFSQVNTWQSKQALPANSRFLAVSFSIGSKGYLGTGFDYSNYYKDFWEYDPNTNTWSQKADFGGGPRAAASAFSTGTKGYVGTGDASSVGYNDLWEYDPSTNVWTRKADFPGNARTVAQAFAIGNKGYIGLGRSTGFSLYNDFWEYNPSTDSWTRKADFAGGVRYATSGFSIDTKGYIGTGTDFTGGGFTFRNDFWEYNQTTDVWTRKADFAGGARELGVGFSIGSKGYIGTGSGTGDFWEYNPSTDVWTRKADFGGGGKNMATGFSLNGKGYLGTGAGGANDFWQYNPMSTPPTTQWAKHPDGIIAGYTNPAISTDPEGNTYVTGGFIGTLTFPTLPSPTTLTSAGEADVFIAKYSASGNVLWAKRAGATHGEVSNAIKYDGFGNIYIAGNYSTSTDFDGIILSNPTTAANNVFLAKYNASTGNLLWVRQGISSSDYSDQTALGLAVDKNGDAYITGYFGIIKFDPLPTLNTVGWWDLYIVKYSSDGIPQWQTTAGSAEAGYYSEVGNSIAVDNTGNVFVTGSINGSSTYPTYFGNISLVSSGGGGFYESNFFLAKYNQSTSSWEWAVEGGGTTNDYGKNVSLDNQGNAYISGYFEGTGTFGSTTLTSTGGRDFFLAKYSANGNQVWMHSVEGVGYYANNTSKVDANGNFYFAGNFDGTITVGDQILTSTGFDNTYVSAWNRNGDFQWVKHVPGNYYTQVNGLDVESNGNINITSVFAGTETFDCSVFSSLSYTDLIIAKLGYTSGSAAPTIQASANNICSGNNTTLSIADGNLNNATDWKWYTGSCGGSLIGSGSSITVTPAQNTIYYARSEGGCAGPSNCGSIAITVNNTTPSISSVTAPLAPIPVNATISLSVSTTANNIASAKIKWGDSTADQIVNNPATNFSVAHTYTSPGVYTVVTTVTDGCGNISASYSYQYIVVYDPGAGFVTGGGWINSPAGGYRPDISLSGKAIFGFEARYQKGANVPTGNTEFKFQVGNLNFKSSNYEWLVVAGSKAQFKGTGTINGGGNYGFLLSAIDGDLGNTVSPDLFRIKIWDINNNGTIVYDNQYGTSDDGVLTTQIAQGSIVIHSNKTASSAMALRENNGNEIAAERKLQFTAIPNPSSNYFRLMLNGLNNEPITVKVIDALGRMIEMRNNVSANKTLTIGENYKPGTYLIEVIQGNIHQTKTVIKQ